MKIEEKAFDCIKNLNIMNKMVTVKSHEKYSLPTSKKSENLNICVKRNLPHSKRKEIRFGRRNG